MSMNYWINIYKLLINLAALLLDGLGALRHGVLGQLTGEDEAHGGLNLAGGQGGLVVVARQLGRLGGNLLDTSLMKEFMMNMAVLEMPVSVWTCFSTL